MKQLFNLFFFCFPVICFSQQTFEFDTYHSDNNQYQTQTYSNILLQQGTEYVIKVQGTMSPWSPMDWIDPCGALENAPQFESDAGSITGIVGYDFAYNFALPNNEYCDQYSDEFPRNTVRLEFSLDGGITWFDPTEDLEYSSDHLYSIRLIGEGHPIMIKSKDIHSSDNYGKYIFTVFTDNTSSNDLVIEAMPEINIYPNPASDYLSIDLEQDAFKLKARIFNATGRLIQEATTIEDGDRIHLQKLASGVYFIQFYSRELGIITTKKFIKIAPVT